MLPIEAALKVLKASSFRCMGACVKGDEDDEGDQGDEDEGKGEGEDEGKDDEDEGNGADRRGRGRGRGRRQGEDKDKGHHLPWLAIHQLSDCWTSDCWTSDRRPSHAGFMKLSASSQVLRATEPNISVLQMSSSVP